MTSDQKPTVGSLFSGIGGFDLGFERAGFETVWQVEIDEYCRRVLERHFPRAERFGDIRECGAHNLKPVDVICGGFPCQPHSVAGNQSGVDDERWLWPEFFRIVCQLRPRFLVVENVPGLLTTAFGQVLGDLACGGFDAEWQSISAAAVGAPHERDRVWIVAYPFAQRRQGILRGLKTISTVSAGTWPAIALDSRCLVVQELEQRLGEPALFGDSDGVSGQVVRLAALGNSIIPDIAQWIAERIKESLHASEVRGMGMGPRTQ